MGHVPKNIEPRLFCLWREKNGLSGANGDREHPRQQLRKAQFERDGLKGHHPNGLHIVGLTYKRMFA